MQSEDNAFNENAEHYDTARPGYPRQLYDTINRHKHFDSNSYILEIGAGTGIASFEIYEKWSPSLVLVEPGNKLCEILGDKFKGKSIEIINTAFENYRTDKLFDGIFSATSFHWIDPSIKYAKCFHLLKPDGLLSVYWNRYAVADNGIGNEIQRVYQNYDGEEIPDNEEVLNLQLNDTMKEIDETQFNSYFMLKDRKHFINILNYNTEKYISLLHSYSGHRKYDSSFYEGIKSIVDRNGGNIDMRILTNLHVYKKINR